MPLLAMHWRNAARVADVATVLDVVVVAAALALAAEPPPQATRVAAKLTADVAANRAVPARRVNRWIGKGTCVPL
jgi:hypothetical protein